MSHWCDKCNTDHNINCPADTIAELKARESSWIALLCRDGDARVSAATRIIAKHTALEERRKGAEELAHSEHKNMLAYRNRRIALEDGLREITAEMEADLECSGHDTGYKDCLKDYRPDLLALLDKESEE